MENSSLKKADVGVFVVWLGGRLWDASDLHACHHIPGKFLGYTYPFTGKGDVKDCRRLLREADEFLADELVSKHILRHNRTLAVFLVTTWEAVEFAQKHKLNQRHKDNRPLMASLIPRSQLVFNYLIIMDGGKYYSPEETGPYTDNDKMAHRLGGVFLGYNTDAPTAGGARLTDFIYRIMGYDLKNDSFPNYDFETLKKMAWHIKKESFNSCSRKEGAIPKYAFDETGKPIFDPRLK